LAEVRTGFKSSMTELRGDTREAIGTMSDVRDSLIRVESKLFPDNPKSVPPTRRRIAKAT
jgi:hypothetical protein